MFKKSLVLAASAGLASADRWAVIAVGSKGYGNYRHQADACHAYQLMKATGIPESNIILMMQDDVANSTENPFPGQLFNSAGNNSQDVYAGCKPTYSGDVVTAQLFLSVITGNTTGVPVNGKVLTSGPGDEVFLNFVDHGGVGIIQFPNGPLLHVSELSSAIQTMQTKNMFSRVLFYMEACESGSMFPNLSATGKVLAVTAANGKESSYGTFCGDGAVVNGKNLNTCLGDLFSVSWMADLVSAGPAQTLKTQIQNVVQATNMSHVQVFGDTSFENDTIGHFESALKAQPSVRTTSSNDLDTRDIPLKQAYWAWEHAETAEEKERAAKQMERIVIERLSDESVFNGIVKEACRDTNMYGCEEHFSNTRSELKDLDCHYRLTRTIHDNCPRRAQHNAGGWNGFNMKFSQVLVNMCEEKESMLGKTDEELNTIATAHCGYQTREQTIVV